MQWLHESDGTTTWRQSQFFESDKVDNLDLISSGREDDDGEELIDFSDAELFASLKPE